MEFSVYTSNRGALHGTLFDLNKYLYTKNEIKICRNPESMAPFATQLEEKSKKSCGRYRFMSDESSIFSELKLLNNSLLISPFKISSSDEI